MDFVSTKICMVKDVGLNDNLFGGNCLQWMDEIAAIYAMKTTKEYNVVTRRFGEIVFQKPIKVHNIVDFYCGNVRKGRTSITFDVEARVSDEVVFKTDCTFVAIDESGNKKEISWT